MENPFKSNACKIFKYHSIWYVTLTYDLLSHKIIIIISVGIIIVEVHTSLGLTPIDSPRRYLSLFLFFSLLIIINFLLR